MIVKEQPSALKLFLVMQGSVVPQILGKILVFTVLAIVVMALDRHVVALPHVSLTALSVFGIALSLFLGFRNNAAYDRWWEGRRIWGGIVSDTRNLARNCEIFIAEKQDRQDILGRAVAFAHAVRGDLHDTDVTGDIAIWVGDDEAARLGAQKGGAEAALRIIAGKVRALHESDRLSGFGQLAFSETVLALGRHQTGCERLATTPLPFVYSLLVRRTTYLYCVLLPFALVETTGPFVPIFVAVVAYVFFGLQAVTNELEHPFRQVQNGLPLRALCRTIEISVAQALDRPAPPPLSPRNGILG